MHSGWQANQAQPKARLEQHLPDAAHVEMGDFHNLGEAIYSGGMCRIQLLLSNGAQGSHKLHNGLTVQLVAAVTEVEVSKCDVTQWLHCSISRDDVHSRSWVPQPARALPPPACQCMMAEQARWTFISCVSVSSFHALAGQRLSWNNVRSQSC